MHDLATIQRLNAEAVSSQDEVLGSIDLKDWLDDAADYSSADTKHVQVAITSHDDRGRVINMTDFRITPQQARAMFFAIASQEN